MRSTILFINIIIVLTFLSCKTTHRVNEVNYDYQSGKITYNSGNVDKNKAYVSEGSFVDLEITNYNPIVIDFSIKKEPNRLFYMENNNPVLNTFLSLPTSETTPKILEDNLKTKFYSFYNSVVSLNYGMDNLQLLKTFKENCFCCELNDLLKHIETTYIDKSIISVDIDDNSCKDCYLNDIQCIKISTAKMIINQKDLYLEAIENKIKEIMRELEKNNLIQEEKIKLTNELRDYSSLKGDFLKTYNNTIETIVRRYSLLASIDFSKKFTRIKVEDTDEFIIKLTAINKITQSTSEFNVIDLPVLKVLKIDFSTGIFFSNLYDQSFTRSISVDTSGTSSYKIKNFDSGKISFGAMGYINFHTQLRQPLNYGISIGAGLMFNQATKLVLSPTASILFGKYQRFILHGGVSFAQVNRIFSAYDKNANVPADYIPETKLEVRSELLIGLSYNLSR